MGGLLPEGLGRATVFGLLRHATELSGSTLYLPHPEHLPLKNIPIVGRFGPHATEERLSQLLDLAARSVPAGCLQVDWSSRLWKRYAFAAGWQAAGGEPCHRSALVLLLPANFGKVLGSAVTVGYAGGGLIVVDEVPLGDGQLFASEGLAGALCPCGCTRSAERRNRKYPPGSPSLDQIRFRPARDGTYRTSFRNASSRSGPQPCWCDRLQQGRRSPPLSRMRWCPRGGALLSSLTLTHLTSTLDR
jgi:hypothetical protein